MIWKLMFLQKDIGNLKKKHIIKQKYPEKFLILCKNVGNLRKVTAKLLLPKFSAVMQ